MPVKEVNDAGRVARRIQVTVSRVGRYPDPPRSGGRRSEKLMGAPNDSRGVDLFMVRLYASAHGSGQRRNEERQLLKGLLEGV